MMGVVRMGFQLDDMRLDGCRCQEFFQLSIVEIGNAQRFGLTFAIGFFELFVAGEEIAGRLMDEEEVDVIELQAF